MISGNDFYKVMCAMVPLYFAMLVAYSSVKWWKIFTPEQCSGINRFVAVFAVPVLSFHFISQNNPYEMDTKFILADTFSKVVVLVSLSVWAIFFRGGLDWLITLFSVATLPNTLVMGIPLLQAMYGDFTQSLMVQLVVLQCIIWYTLLLFLFEYRAATLLIQAQFPGSAAAAISKFELDNDVISLDGRDPLRTESELDPNGRTIRVRIRRSTSSTADNHSTLSPSITITPRASNLSNAEIFSVNTPPPLFQHDIAFGNTELALGYRSASPRQSGYASSDAYSLQPTPRASNFNELETTTATTAANTPVWSRSPVAGRVFRQPSPAFSGVKMVWESPGKCAQGERQGCKDVMVAGKEISFRDCTKIQMPEEADTKAAPTDQEMPHAFVILRLILTVAALPQGIVPFVFAREYGLHPDILSTG
uniref:Auxin polar transport protein n=1 Tax=Betula pendula TaxID=3505 RepID=A0A385H4Z5_BETPN|nr:auxin polar transport protein [Betula pendula]